MLSSLLRYISISYKPINCSRFSFRKAPQHNQNIYEQIFKPSASDRRRTRRLAVIASNSLVSQREHLEAYYKKLMTEFSKSLSAFMNRVPHVGEHSNQQDSTDDCRWFTSGSPEAIRCRHLLNFLIPILKNQHPTTRASLHKVQKSMLRYEILIHTYVFWKKKVKIKQKSSWQSQ